MLICRTVNNNKRLCATCASFEFLCKSNLVSMLKREMPPKQRVIAPSSSAVAKPREYGDLEASDEVHEEIVQLGKQVQQHLRKLNPQTEQEMLATLQQFGPSEQSKQMLRKEMEGAHMAMAQGLYVVFRNVSKAQSSYNDGKTNECCRIGPSHRCFCGHALAEHAPLSTRGGAPKCGMCACSAFCYIPNMPEEVGDGHLSRRSGFDPGAWSPKCRCGHGSLDHDGGSRYKRCRACQRCAGYDAHFMCAVCDGKWEDHQTIVENDQVRRAEGRTTGEAYKPLAQVHPAFSELVFESKQRQLVEAPPSALARQERPVPRVGGDPFAAPLTACASCGTPYKTAQSKFCSRCGAPRTA